MSRQKLEKLGLHLPLFPTTSVGSFPKPDYLVKARADFNKGKITEQQLVELERKATAFWIAKQEELDIDVLVDGEMYRGDMVAHFAERLRSEEHTSELQSPCNLVCRLLLEKKKKKIHNSIYVRL